MVKEAHKKRKVGGDWLDSDARQRVFSDKLVGVFSRLSVLGCHVERESERMGKNVRAMIRQICVCNVKKNP